MRESEEKTERMECGFALSFLPPSLTAYCCFIFKELIVINFDRLELWMKRK